MKCSNTTFSSESTGTSVSSLTITPTYSGCEAFGVSEAEGSKVTMNGCTFILTPISKTKALMVIQCPVGKEVTIDIGKDICLVHIAPQSPGEKIDLVVGGGDVVHKATVDNVTSTVTYGAEGSLLLCGASGTRTLSYTGEVQMGGYKNAALTEETTVGVE
jgi:hypothetical protein